MSDIHNVTEEEMRKARDAAREKFITERAIYERQFEEWYKGLLANTKLHSEIPFSITGWSIREKVPELYEEFPNEEIATQQMDALEAQIRQIDEIVHQKNLAAHQKHLEFVAAREQALSS